MRGVERHTDILNKNGASPKADNRRITLSKARCSGEVFLSSVARK